MRAQYIPHVKRGQCAETSRGEGLGGPRKRHKGELGVGKKKAEPLDQFGSDGTGSARLYDGRPAAGERRQDRRRKEKTQTVSIVTGGLTQSRCDCPRRGRAHDARQLHGLPHPSAGRQQILALDQQRNRDRLRGREEARKTANQEAQRIELRQSRDEGQQQNQYAARHIAHDHCAPRIPAIRENPRHRTQHDRRSQRRQQHTGRVPSRSVHPEHHCHLDREGGDEIAEQTDGLRDPQG
jgi:hypothetical protein